VTSDIYSDGTYLAANPGWHSEHSRWKAAQCQALLSELRIEPSSICDVGCGAGGVLARLGEAYPQAKLSGFDPSVAAIQMAQRDHPAIDFAVGEVEGEFDLVLVMDVIEHVEDCFGFVRGLRPHADVLLIHIPLELSCFYLWRNVLMTNRRHLGHIHYFTRDTALALLTDAGFEILADRYTPSYVDHAARDPKSRVVTAIQRAGFRLAPDRSSVLIGGYSLLVAARPLRER